VRASEVDGQLMLKRGKETCGRIEYSLNLGHGLPL
jgi:hypothetical protein